MAKLINGNGNPAIYAAEDADLIASLAGNVTCIANVGNKYAATEEDATTIRLDDGVIITKEGRRIQLEPGESDTFYIPTGTSGQTNYYIIGYKLVQNADSTQVAEQFVQKMNSSSETITEDTFRSGATEVYVSVYRVTQVGFTIDSISGLLPELLDNASIKDNIDQINSDLSDKVSKSGDTMNGALNFANNLWNNIGDDCKFGDVGVAGGFAMQGITGETRIHMNNTDGSKAGQLIFKNGGFFEFVAPVQFNGGITTPAQTSSSTILNWIINHGGTFGCMGFQNVSDAPTSTGEYSVFWFGSEDRINVYATRFLGGVEIYCRSIFGNSWSIYTPNWSQIPAMSVSGTTLNITL